MCMPSSLLRRLQSVSEACLLAHWSLVACQAAAGISAAADWRLAQWPGAFMLMPGTW